ncbi:MATE family efflux transporter [Butyrivibrio sp. FCS014]|uniref:MATE family efflux transporter n=1 Tax=Butyrivibrio sp. FCS014 TaxID=1408304 RepID=UPI000464AEEF|nr:MATE family efflux transporter [Butyrivibrio sp. FCS014]
MKMKAFDAVDMTVGRPWEQILKFTVPMLFGNVVQQLYSTVDSIVVGRYVGDNALAAVGSAAPIFNLLLILFIGISMGATIMVYLSRSEAYPIGNRDMIYWSLLIAWAIGAAMSIFFYKFGKWRQKGVV